MGYCDRTYFRDGIVIASYGYDSDSRVTSITYGTYRELLIAAEQTGLGNPWAPVIEFIGRHSSRRLFIRDRSRVAPAPSGVTYPDCAQCTALE